MQNVERGNSIFILSFAAIFLFLFALVSSVLAHGGEDHGDNQPKTVSNQKGMITRTARAGEFEVTLKHSPILPDTATAARIFVTRSATNEAFGEAQPVVEITAQDGKTYQISEIKAEATGSYSLRLPPLPDGHYTILTRLSAAGKSATGEFSAISVEPLAAPAVLADVTAVVSWARTALMILAGIVTLGLFGGLTFFAYRFVRRNRMSEEAVSV